MLPPSAKLNFYSDKFDARCLSWLKSGCLSNIEVSLPRIVSPQTADFRASFGENHSLTHFGPMKALKCYTQQESFEKRWTPSCIGEILIQKHNQSPEPYGIQRFNKIDAMNLIFANFDTAKHPILAQNMPFWAFKSLNKSIKTSRPPVCERCCFRLHHGVGNIAKLSLPLQRPSSSIFSC